MVSLLASAYHFVSLAVREQFGCSSAVTALGFVLNVLVRGLSGLNLWPLSDSYGRKCVPGGSSLLWALFHIGTPRMINFHTLLVCRRLTGLFESTSLALVSLAGFELYVELDIAKGTFIFMGLCEHLSRFQRESSCGLGLHRSCWHPRAGPRPHCWRLRQRICAPARVR
ncbi:hypothetical protein K437DRAFT_257640 [Tilletiaria anomala UBC 951]|uniref:Major facilitator superfamily (MFS) profile domain-containing protein n=1 Tax=Tilletiaria anomala (strain ATCC 24038 / CBS 436.72 / UBC 951) TaxID=1037660 RepID=A0A066VMX9_TILAU|nr:uncharacterized protein K437DRAFT_257640 [Tilletiaria anomala UBC 951]KDN43112.1 hypothetical protein K437DRAFT_257640 [Tilletiaria anomala UBC 951]